MAFHYLQSTAAKYIYSSEHKPNKANDLHILDVKNPSERLWIT